MFHKISTLKLGLSYFLFTVSCLLFLLITPSIVKPALAVGATDLDTSPQVCAPSGGVNITFTWTPQPDGAFFQKGAQYLDLSTSATNPFGTGNYIGQDVTGLSTYSTSTAPGNIGPLIPNTRHYWRINTQNLLNPDPGSPGGYRWYASDTTGIFDTIDCSGGEVYPWELSIISISGTYVNFHIVPNSGTGSVLILTDLPADADLQGQTIPPDVSDFALNLPVGNHTAVVSYLATQKSNAVDFSIGGASWNNPGDPAPPFNILDVFQPAKRFGSFGQLASDVLLILVGLAGAVAVIFIMLSGFKFVTSSGDEKQLASARATLTYAIIGIAVVILAFVIVQVLQYFLQSSIPIT